MNKPTKAALLSMLVFPGLEHLYLKKLSLGLLLSIGAATATYFMVSSAVQTALEVVEIMQDGSVPMEADAITALVSEQSQASEYSTNIAMMMLFTFWVIGILDSFRVGRILEKADGIAGENKT